MHGRRGTADRARRIDGAHARLYETVRTAHLERARVLEPAAIIYRRRRYDFDAAAAQGLELIQASPLRAGWLLFRSDVRVLEINEPLQLSSSAATALALAFLAASRITGRSRTTVVAYAIENADPRRFPTLDRLVERTMPAIPPVICHVGLEGEVPDLPHELVVHADPLLVVRRGIDAPEGGTALTIQARGKIAEDVLTALARHRIDLREQVLTRVDLTPRELVQQWHGSPYGVLWQGRRTVRDRLGPRTPIEGLYVAGAHGAPGAGVPFVTQSAALVAQLIGPA